MSPQERRQGLLRERAAALQAPPEAHNAHYGGREVRRIRRRTRRRGWNRGLRERAQGWETNHAARNPLAE